MACLREVGLAPVSYITSMGVIFSVEVMAVLLYCGRLIEKRAHNKYDKFNYIVLHKYSLTFDIQN